MHGSMHICLCPFCTHPTHPHSKALKVQLLDFSVTGYDLHLDHSIVHTELRQLSQLLEERCKTVAQVSGMSPSGQVGRCLTGGASGV